MSRQSRLVVYIPFIILLSIVLYTWIRILSTDYSSTLKHQIALGLCLINALLYFRWVKYAIVLTGIILILATFNFLALFLEIESTSYFVKISGHEFSSPRLQGKSVLVLLLYLVIMLYYRRIIFRSSNS